LVASALLIIERRQKNRRHLVSMAPADLFEDFLKNNLPKAPMGIDVDECFSVVV
jgi:hypothetical protein